MKGRHKVSENMAQKHKLLTRRNLEWHQ